MNNDLSVKNEEALDALISDFTDYRKIVENQKLRGVNDYNLMTATLKAHDEVRLHTRFIYSLINPKGKHYQGSLFLRLFLEKIDDDISKYGNLDDAEVYKERNNIDLHIVSGDQHIIIENKVNAGDQKGQIYRYIAWVVEEYGADPKNILVVYLTKGREFPSEYSLTHEGSRITLGEERKNGERLLKINNQGDGVARYKPMYYRSSVGSVPSVLGWLRSCEAQVYNITNLMYAIEEYRSVVERMYKSYRGGLMKFSEFVMKGGDNIQDRMEVIAAIYREIPAFYDELLRDAFMDGFPGMVEGLETSGAVVRLNKENSEGFKDYLFKESDSKDVFSGSVSSKSRPKDKGVLWGVVSDPGKDTFGFGVFFGVKAFHVGVFPLTSVGGKYHSVKSLKYPDQAVFSGSEKKVFESPKHRTWIAIGLSSKRANMNEEISSWWNLPASSIGDEFIRLVDSIEKHVVKQR